jgi:hypothetical protein
MKTFQPLDLSLYKYERIPVVLYTAWGVKRQLLQPCTITIHLPRNRPWHVPSCHEFWPFRRLWPSVMRTNLPDRP